MKEDCGSFFRISRTTLRPPKPESKNPSTYPLFPATTRRAALYIGLPSQPKGIVVGYAPQLEDEYAIDHQVEWNRHADDRHSCLWTDRAGSGPCPSVVHYGSREFQPHCCGSRQIPGFLPGCHWTSAQRSSA